MSIGRTHLQVEGAPRAHVPLCGLLTQLRRQLLPVSPHGIQQPHKNGGARDQSILLILRKLQLVCQPARAPPRLQDSMCTKSSRAGCRTKDAGDRGMVSTGEAARNR